MMLTRHAFARAVKEVLYGAAGEPYRLPTGEKLRFTIGTRPVRTRFSEAQENSARFDALQTLMMCSRLQPGSTAIDVGANVGSTTLVMAARCGAHGHVVAFEPEPSARRMLQRNIALNPDVGPVVIEEAACADREGEAAFYARGRARSSLDGDPNDPSENALTVPLTTLDAYVASAGLTPHLIKIDVEGAEVHVLRGAQRLLSSDATFLCELHPFAWQRNNVSFHDLLAALKPSGRRIRFLGADENLSGEPEYGIAELIR